MSFAPIHPALLQLIRLNARARWRRIWRGLKTPKGIILGILALGMLCTWIVPTVVMSFFRARTDPTVMRATISFGLLAFCLVNLLTVKPGSGIAFASAEVDFLFPGPFRRRELLAYKFLGIAIASFGASIFPALILLPHVTYFIAGYLGAALAFMFIQLIHVAASLLAGSVAMRAFSVARRAVLFVGIIAIVLSVRYALELEDGRSFTSTIASLRESWIGACVLAPFDVFGRIATAQSLFPDLIGWAAVAVAMNAALVAILLWLDADYLEASIETSRKLHDRIQNMRRGQHPFTASTLLRIKARIPALPWLGGVGPNAWRQLVIAVRSSGAFAVFFTIIAVMTLGPMLLVRRSTASPDVPIAVLTGPAIMMTLFMLPQFIRFDFRGDIDRIDALKSLPIGPAAIVIGQVAVPVLFATVLQVGLMAVASWVQGSLSFYLVAAACFTLPLNMLIFGLENLMFLWYPYRQIPGSFDLTAMGNQMLLMFMRMIVLFVAIGIAGLIGGLAYAVTGSQIAFAAAAWISLSGFGMAFVPILTTAYTRFDPSRDTPG